MSASSPPGVPVRIRLASPADGEVVLRLLAAQFDEHGIDWDEAPLRGAVNAVLADGSLGRFLLAEDAGDSTTPTQGGVIGLANLAFTFTLEVAGRAAWLDELYVVPERRGAGVGGRLLREAIRVARAEGCRSLELEVERGHRRVEGLYRRSGFRARERSRWCLPLDEPPGGD